MAMSGATLGNALAAATGTSGDAEAKAIWIDIATEIVNHIVSNAEVATVVSTTGSAAAQTGTGTGTVS